MQHRNNAEWGMRNAECQGKRRAATALPLQFRTSHSAFRIPHLRRRPVALLELLTAAAGTRVVAADAGVRVGSDTGSNRRRLGGDGRIATYETIDRRLARDHGRGATG